MAIAINSNIASLQTQRRLDVNTSSLQQSFRRLSSGLRINRASDDAAGLAVSANLELDSRVYSQGIRNINDALSVLSIAEGATEQLSSIVIRMTELAEQSANGAIPLTQRKALQQEADSLVAEYNRISAATEFNSLQLLNSSASNLRIQTGYGVSGSIAMMIGDELGQSVWNATGTLLQNTVGADSGPSGVALSDVNNDGRLDLISSNYAGGAGDTVNVHFGNSDGSFAAASVYSSGVGAYSVQALDVNADGSEDLLVAASADGTLDVLLGNGNGTFKARTSFVLGGVSAFGVGDFNGDGIADIVGSTPGLDQATLLIGNGNGTFKTASLFPVGDSPFRAEAADVNYDGLLDIITVNNGDDSISVLLGNGNGTFKSQRNYYTGDNPGGIELVDLDRDGYLDAIISAQDDDQIRILLGNTDGSFRNGQVASAGDRPSEIAQTDLNGDGLIDLVVTSTLDTRISIYFGNGTGSFRARISFVAASGPTGVAAEDLNGDGLDDIIVAASSGTTTNVFLLGATKQSTLPSVNILRPEYAREALDTMEEALNRVNAERGSIGALQSRFSTAASVLEQMRENYLAAASQITDVDVAAESALLVKSRILQEAAAAVLSQANVLPSLALRLLTG